MLFRMLVLGGAAIGAKRGLLQCAGAAGHGEEAGCTVGDGRRDRTFGIDGSPARAWLAARIR
jgi:hypothetical protein